MPVIAPVSELRNYGNVLERDMKDEEYFQKAEAMIQLFCELNAGIRSAEEEGWVSEEEMREHFHRRREEAK